MNTPSLFADQQMINFYNYHPSEVKGVHNRETEFHKRYLWFKIYSTLKLTIPNNWDMNTFRYWLFRVGSIAVIYTKEYGWIAQPYSIDEINMNYNPKVITVYNQFVKTPKKGIIGVNAGIIKIMDDYYGLDDLVTRYAVMLAQVDRSLNVNLMNSNVTMLFEAENKKNAEEIKAAYGKATSGEPMVVLNKDVMNGKNITTLVPNPSGTFIGDKLEVLRRTIVNQFLTEVGIKNANYEKKERLNSQEVEQNNDETQAIISIIKDNIKDSMDRINKISTLGLDVSYKYNYDTEEGGGDNET